MYNKADQTKTVTCVEYDNDTPTARVQISNTSSGTMLVSCDGLVASNVNTEIDEGTDSTFVLQADITNPNNAAGDGGVSVLQVTLQEFDDISVTGFGANTSAKAHIQWIDKDQANTYAAGNVFTWIEYPETSVKSTSYNS